MRYSRLRLSPVTGGVLTASLHRPRSRNALDGVFITELRSLLRRVALSSDVEGLVLQGAGRVFCAGGRVQWLRAARNRTPEKNLAQARSLVHLLSELAALPVPVVCAVQGAAIGGGLGLVCAADVAVCTEGSVFSLSEARLGLVPSCIAPFVAARIGFSWTRRFMLTGERFGARQALAMGLVHEVVADQKALGHAVERILKAVRASAPSVVRATKRMLNDLGSKAGGWNCAQAQETAARIFAGSLVASAGQEGLAAFLEKRQPAWRVQRGVPSARHRVPTGKGPGASEAATKRLSSRRRAAPASPSKELEARRGSPFSRVR
jgi:enoyl-CoA hydratase/carnithine racemase